LELKKIGKSLAKAAFNVPVLRNEMKNGPYQAIRKSFKMIKNELYEDEEDFFKVAYAEINWGTVFAIMENHPDRKNLEIEVYPVEYTGMPVLNKKIVDVSNGKFEFKVVEKDGQDFMIIGKDLLTEPDAWIDFFLGGRYYDPINSEWEKTIIDFDKG